MLVKSLRAPAVEKFLARQCDPAKLVAADAAESWLSDVIAICEDGAIGAIPLGLPVGGVGPDGFTVGPGTPELEWVKLTVFARGESGEVPRDPEQPEFLILDVPMEPQGGGTYKLPIAPGVMLTGRHYLAAVSCKQPTFEGDPETPVCYKFVVLVA